MSVKNFGSCELDAVIFPRSVRRKTCEKPPAARACRRSPAMHREASEAGVSKVPQADPKGPQVLPSQLAAGTI